MKKEKVLKVWGGTVDGLYRGVVCAYTMQQAMDITGINSFSFMRYWRETKNAEELSVANEIGYWRYTDWYKKKEFIRIK